MSQASPPAVEPESSPWNVPNALTTFRLVLVPVFAWMLLAHPTGTGWQLATALVFTIAILTDLLDGYLARKHDIVTKFGKLADPIADKALTGMAFIGLSINGDLWWWVTILILVREWGITLMRFLMLRYGVMAAGRGGKLKTVTQAVAVILYLLPLPGWAEPVAWVAMGLAFLLTMVTGLDYCWQAGSCAATAVGRAPPETRVTVQAEELEAGARAVIGALASRGDTLATAESLTGGWIGMALTGVPGASAVYRGGLITYATDLKAALAGVQTTTLDRDGPVAPTTAAELASGAASRCEADWGLAVTGVAGPDPQDGHPVGQVFVAVVGPGHLSMVTELSLDGTRAEIRAATVVRALGLLLSALLD